MHYILYHSSYTYQTACFTFIETPCAGTNLAPLFNRQVKSWSHMLTIGRSASCKKVTSSFPHPICLPSVATRCPFYCLNDIT